MMNITLSLALLCTLLVASAHGSVIYTAYRNATGQVTLGSLEPTTGKVTPACDIPQPKGPYVYPGAYTTEMAYPTDADELALVTITPSGGCIGASTVPFSPPDASVVLVAEPDNGAGRGSYLAINGSMVTFGSIDINAATLSPSGSMAVFSDAEIVSSTWDSVNNIFVLTDGVNMYRGSYPARIYPMPEGMTVTALAFNWRNNGYYGIILPATDADIAYIAQLKLSSPVKVTKVIELPGFGFGTECASAATYDIPSGTMFSACTTPGSGNMLIEASLSSSTFTALPMPADAPLPLFMIAVR
ncbi:uncharacterized protein AMSG_01190 [Thecamonas trahens ATCC 50062]|uniref:Uncharacterized protein n=1 Tax=Thecamonas trahens ATCC 50062 TaxID=461836 RepID=A0A0L0DN80_THETB|nr:hypothetical protein AMSG_01190 [Thecamonas trahens ATCC 50062]KNC53476.1 hypothetical protein AMSG_01190 [Thecamonas trahens ATCC 50062]|eukprot:XP_013761800.1 hypothetical protein AMSG_01190 [Thecamonas trahens ATCC 50062]